MNTEKKNKKTIKKSNGKQTSKNIFRFFLSKYPKKTPLWHRYIYMIKQSKNKDVIEKIEDKKNIIEDLWDVDIKEIPTDIGYTAYKYFEIFILSHPMYRDIKKYKLSTDFFITRKDKTKGYFKKNLMIIPIEFKGYLNDDNKLIYKGKEYCLNLLSKLLYPTKKMTWKRRKLKISLKRNDFDFEKLKIESLNKKIPTPTKKLYKKCVNDLDNLLSKEKDKSAKIKNMIKFIETYF